MSNQQQTDAELAIVMVDSQHGNVSTPHRALVFVQLAHYSTDTPVSIDRLQ